jgi:hypothetical protein
MAEAERPLDGLSRAVAERRHSRRTLLKIGSVALIATAFPGTARATHRNCRERCVGNVCGFDPFERCGSNEQTGDCVCAATVNGKCKCYQPICLGGETCTGSRQCPEGYSCVNAQCCGQSICAALCDTNIGVLRAGVTRWA